MKDEEYVFMQDIKEKKSIARGAFHKKGGSKSKKCTLPSDYLTRKEREKMNGEVKRWNMNEFYTWKEFKAMPKDIAAAYISTLNQKYRVSVATIGAELFHVSKACLNAHLHKHGITELMKTKQYTNRGNTKVIDDFKKAILAARVPKTEVPADIFIPDGMAPGYCSDGTKVEDAIKEAVNAVNKKLAEDTSVSTKEVIAGMDEVIADIYMPTVDDVVAEHQRFVHNNEKIRKAYEAVADIHKKIGGPKSGENIVGKTWNMNELYTWEEFKQMPDDIKVAYISALNQNCKLNQRAIASTVFHIPENTFSIYLKRSGLKDKLNLIPYRREDAIKELVPAPDDDEPGPFLDFSHNPDGEFVYLPHTPPKLDDEPEKERPSISSLSFVMHGVDKERVADILSWFEGKDVTITLNITEKM